MAAHLRAYKYINQEQCVHSNYISAALLKKKTAHKIECVQKREKCHKTH
jgi:hypothetical protein